MDRKQKAVVLWALVAVMLLNALFSGYLWLQKQAMLNGTSFFNDSCFVNTVGPGNCADVQLSVYGEFFGVPLSIWGMLAFIFMAVLIGCFAYSLMHNHPIKSSEFNFTRNFISLCFIVGSLAAAYFIYLQLFELDAICKYCMILDSLTIVSSIIYITIFKKSVSFFSP